VKAAGISNSAISFNLIRKMIIIIIFVDINTIEREVPEGFIFDCIFSVIFAVIISS
jgi:hypothetical protein